MKKEYNYPLQKIIFPYALFFLIPIIFLPMLFSEFNLKDDSLIIYAVLLLNILITVPVAVWMINNIKTVIQVDDIGINYKSLFKNIRIKWHEIARIEKKIPL